MDLAGSSSNAQVWNFSPFLFTGIFLPDIKPDIIQCLLQKAKHHHLREATNWTQIIPVISCTTIPISSHSETPPYAAFQGFGHIPAVIFPAILLHLWLLCWSTPNASSCPGARALPLLIHHKTLLFCGNICSFVLHPNTPHILQKFLFLQVWLLFASSNVHTWHAKKRYLTRGKVRSSWIILTAGWRGPN